MFPFYALTFILVPISVLTQTAGIRQTRVYYYSEDAGRLLQDAFCG